MSVGKITSFDVQTGVWSSYIDRLEMYFTANDVNEDKKLAVLIAVMGDSAYELLVSLASPQKPSTLTYGEVVEMLGSHLQPAPSALAERYRFRQRRQGERENIANYVAELKKLTRDCQFGSNLNENLRDQFVCGVRSDIIRQRLFAEDDSMIFARAVKLATSLEAAERDSAAVDALTSSAGIGDGAAETRESSVHALGATGDSWRAAARGNRGRRGARGRSYGRTTAAEQATNGTHCLGCGATHHNYRSCRFRSYECSFCRRIGHLRRVCPGRGATTATAAQQCGTVGVYHGKAQEELAGDDQDYGDLGADFHQLCLNDYKAVSVPVFIEGHCINMEIDTGTAVSCINKNTYDKYFSHLILKEGSVKLRFYDGTCMKPLGIIKPNVSYGTEKKVLELFVIQGGTTSLIGRQWLTELKIKIPTFSNCLKIDNQSLECNKVIVNILNRYKELFGDGLGRYTGGKATLKLREQAVPVFHRARPLPYALRERVDAALDTMLRDGVIEPVDCSDWASPLVPVNKPDGTLRLCADYKSTVNPSLIVDRYPLPKIEDLLVNLNGHQYFSKIDLSQAYSQIELDDSKKYTVINTHRGLFRYNRLVFGLASSVGIFQRIMTNTLQGIPHVQIFLDDVIIGGKTIDAHLKALEEVFSRLERYGFKLRQDKCIFLANEVTYLGYTVSKDGVKVDNSKVEAIVKMGRPQNVSELRSFLGMVNFFGKFIKNLSSVLYPLYNLLRKGIVWNWDTQCEQAFSATKKLLSSARVLAHYDPSKQLILTCDASARGLGAVLSQPGTRGERPVAFASRSLNEAEKNYSQIHREALAIIFGVNKFHQYLYGRKFTLRTDHKPLVSIFGPNKGIPSMTASRMQRWAIILSAYTFDIEYVRTDDNCADGLSRLPQVSKINNINQMPEQTYLHFAQEAFLLDYNVIKKMTEKDPTLARVLSYLRDGWPDHCDIVGLQPYYNRKSELYAELGCIMWGHRVVVPEACRARVLEVLHEPHMGIVKSKSMARSYVWWPGVDEAVEAICRACVVCAAHADAPATHQPRSWPWPTRPWSRIHLDFLGPIYGKLYLVIVDATSKWIEVFNVASTNANGTIDKLTELWSRWGLPKQIVTDNGPPFTSKEFENFMQIGGIEHIFTAPYHPASNGAAENAVRTLKKVIKKAVSAKVDINKALNIFLMHYRNTPHSTTGESPSIILTNRRLRTRLDKLKPDREAVAKQAQKRQVESAGGAERTVGVGEDVWYRQYLKSDKWLPGVVSGTIGRTNYKVRDSGGKDIHRHIDQIKRRSRGSLVCPVSTEAVAETDEVGSASASSPPRTAERSEVPPLQTLSQTASPLRDENEHFVTPERSPEVPGQSPNAHVSPQPRPIRKCRLRNKML